ncbi:uncharacterized protein LY89DRAFT_103619 [Mollisia scopiformis]|uniref:Uncharacterized protein n=1 Tax=Mollisia scopiformis TaxID=149040 RepID=A0A194X4M3_MOLSC|nr:uncharacterized protein LY89DRAFT_103619 [Mollisia scopiformis]KUJ15116.1 hypothetical protein LY89DRAFT_103619 [Mollisia scopiformis]
MRMAKDCQPSPITLCQVPEHLLFQQTLWSFPTTLPLFTLLGLGQILLEAITSGLEVSTRQMRHGSWLVISLMELVQTRIGFFLARGTMSGVSLHLMGTRSLHKHQQCSPHLQPAQSLKGVLDPLALLPHLGVLLEPVPRFLLKAEAHFLLPGFQLKLPHLRRSQRMA